MYKLILGHFHLHRKSNMASMEAILNCFRKFVRVFTIGFSLPCVIIVPIWELRVYDIQNDRRNVIYKTDIDET